MKIRLIESSNVEDFERIRADVDRVTRGAAHGEFTTDDLKKFIADKTAFAGYVMEDSGEITVCFVWEMVFYPRKTGVNIMALAGRKFYRSCEHYLRFMEKVWRMQGATFVECSSTPAMARFLSRAGFAEVYRLSRKELLNAEDDE